MKPGENYEHDQPCINPDHAGQTYAQCQHTPGPWTIVTKQKVYSIRAGAYDPSNGTMGDVIATVPRCTIAEGHDCCYFDARLIAKAPEMLGMLRHLIQVDGDPLAEELDITHIADAARALLREIEGKTNGLP